MKRTIGLLVVLGLIAAPASAGVIFEQDFSSSTNVGDYVNATATTANTTQFGLLDTADSAGVFDITSGALTLDRTPVGYAANKMARGALDGGSLLSMKFDLKVTSANYAQNGTGFYLGAASDASVNVLGPYNNRFIFLTFTGVDGDGFTMAAGGGSTSAKVTIGDTDQWAIFCNNTASAQSYAAPDGSTSSVAARSFDLWIDNTVMFDDEARYASFSDTKILSGFMMAWSKNDDGLWAFDNMVIRNDLDVVPEPGTLVLLGLGGLAALRRRK